MNRTLDVRLFKRGNRFLIYDKTKPIYTPTMFVFALDGVVDGFDIKSILGRESLLESIKKRNGVEVDIIVYGDSIERVIETDGKFITWT